MKKFLFKLSLFLAFPLAALAWARHGYFKMYPPERNYYLAALDKIQLVRTQASPRLVFIGGSSAAFGIDSGMMAPRLGMHPVNMAVQVGLGLDFSLDSVEPWLRSGDVVVLALEYEAYMRHYRALPEELARFAETEPWLLRTFSLRQLKEILDRGYAIHLNRLLRASTGRPVQLLETGIEVYTRQGFDANGDFIAHHHQPPPVIAPGGSSAWIRFKDASQIREAVEHINRLAAHCEARGARIFITHPPLLDRVYDRSRESIGRLDELLRRELRVPMLDKPEDSVFPMRLFYDTHYHLTAEGKRIRSEALAVRLKLALDQRP